ncbi:MAG: Gfo/Idh/MocA family protein [Arachnia propionica]
MHAPGPALRLHRRHERRSRAGGRRYGYERSDTDWRAIADDPDIQVVSVVIANSLHLEVVRGLIEAGKHVLCEKPLSDTLASARKMADLAREAFSVVRIGLTYRRQLPPGHALAGRPVPQR